MLTSLEICSDKILIKQNSINLAHSNDHLLTATKHKEAVLTEETTPTAAFSDVLGEQGHFHN